MATNYLRHYIRSIGLYWNTLRHLKLIQIFNRVARKLPRAIPRIRHIPKLRNKTQHTVETILRKQSLFSPNEFQFLNVSGNLAEIAWNGPQRSLLWRYNQHYFDDLNAQNAKNRQDWHRSLVQNWIAANPPNKGVAWHPYPISLRIVNWIKWYWSGNVLNCEDTRNGMVDGLRSTGGSCSDCTTRSKNINGMARGVRSTGVACAVFYESFVQSLLTQAMYLNRIVEWHLLGNHLFANAKALLFAGTFFEGRVAQTLWQKGLRVLREQLPEQILADGGHFERSPMYHAIILEDILDILNLCCAYNLGNELSALCVEYARRMLYWLRVMVHPDGEISFFNDAALGIAPSLDQLQNYANRLKITMSTAHLPHCVHLRETGYIRLESEHAFAILNVGSVGPRYQMGHAHANNLSFECSLYNKRVFVNGGTSCYGSSTQRTKERQTSAHNTVEIAGKNSSEIWSGFRIARRAQSTYLSIQETNDTLIVTCSHNGYRHLARGAVHNRTWIFSLRNNEECLKIIDYINTSMDAQSILRMHPHIKIRNCFSQEVLLAVDSDHNARIHSQDHAMLIRKTFYAEYFGAIQNAYSIITPVTHKIAKKNTHNILTINWH